jgi:hypothetical protein
MLIQKLRTLSHSDLKQPLGLAAGDSGASTLGAEGLPAETERVRMAVGSAIASDVVQLEA